MLGVSQGYAGQRLSVAEAASCIRSGGAIAKHEGSGKRDKSIATGRHPIDRGARKPVEGSSVRAAALWMLRDGAWDDPVAARAGFLRPCPVCAGRTDR